MLNAFIKKFGKAYSNVAIPDVANGLKKITINAPPVGLTPSFQLNNPPSMVDGSNSVSGTSLGHGHDNDLKKKRRTQALRGSGRARECVDGQLVQPLLMSVVGVAVEENQQTHSMEKPGDHGIMGIRE